MIDGTPDLIVLGFGLAALVCLIPVTGFVYGKYRAWRGDPVDVEDPMAAAVAWNEDRKSDTEDRNDE